MGELNLTFSDEPTIIIWRATPRGAIDGRLSAVGGTRVDAELENLQPDSNVHGDTTSLPGYDSHGGWRRIRTSASNSLR